MMTATSTYIRDFCRSESNEWYTPAAVVEAARDVLGGIDLDPASCAEANETVRASRYYTIADDGLAHDWPGRVWLNAPYGKIGGKSNQVLWAHRLIEQYQAGITTAAILIVNAQTGYLWFRPLFQFPICFTERLRFRKPGGIVLDKTINSSAIVYLGQRPALFAQRFAEFGPVMVAI